MRDPKNCPSCYNDSSTPASSTATITNTAATVDDTSKACEEEILRAVHRGRYMVKEMIGVVQIKKYRAMKQRYGGDDTAITTHNSSRTATTGSNVKTTALPGRDDDDDDDDDGGVGDDNDDVVIQKAIHHLEEKAKENT